MAIIEMLESCPKAEPKPPVTVSVKWSTMRFTPRKSVTSVYGIGKAIDAEPKRLVRKTPKTGYWAAMF